MTQINATATPVALKNPAVTPQAQPSTLEATLYVGDLLPHVTEGVLLSVFNKEAGLMSVRVCRDSNTGNSLGYAYVNFQTADAAHRAMEKFNFTPIANKW